MTESKLEIWQRKIRNGKRKQAEVIQQEKDKVWAKLKEVQATKSRRIDIDILKAAVTRKKL